MKTPSPTLDLERLLAALLKPTIEMMQAAGIARMACGRDKSFVLQMESGATVTIDPPKAHENT